MPFLFHKPIVHLLAKDSSYEQTYAGITPNGLQFFCALVYDKSLPKEHSIKLSLGHLIDKYAKSKNNEQREQVKQEILTECLGKVEGIALLFSSNKFLVDKTYGFVHGERITLTTTTNPREFVDLDHEGNVSSLYPIYNHFAFITNKLNSESKKSIENFEDREYDTEVIYQIKRMGFKWPDDYFREYFCEATKKIKSDNELKQKLTDLSDAMGKLGYSEKDIALQVYQLTLQLLNKNYTEEEKEQLFKDYRELATKVYGSYLPYQMIFGIMIGLVTLAAFVSLSLLNPVIPTMLIILGVFDLMCSLSFIARGRYDFYFDPQTVNKRLIANSLFAVAKDPSLKDSEKIIPSVIMQEAKLSGVL